MDGQQTTSATIVASRATTTDLPIYRLSVDQYHAMIRIGTLTEDDPVELIEGLLVYRMSQTPLHAVGNEVLGEWIRPRLSAGWHYRLSTPITLPDGEPEPDGAIVRGRRFDYRPGHPGPADVAVVFEVADSSLERDRGIKLRSYARAGIEVYVIVNLIDMKIEVYHLPKNEQYELFKSIGRGERVTLPGELEVELVVDEILPPELVGGGQ
jgi:Uma2 family endonuclease